MVAQISLAKRICRIAAALLLLGLTAQADIDEPFGLPTVAAPDGPLSVTWRDLQSKIQSERSIIAQCRAEPDACSSPAALQFIAIVNEGAQYQGLTRIGRINRAVNFAIRPINPAAPGDVGTKWTSPLTTLTAGIGDCKQYAVLKYAALSDAGIAPDDLRLVIVTIKSQRANHVVIAVRHAAHWFILDNRTLAVVESRELPDYLPQFTLDHRGMRQFIPPSSPQVAGSPCTGVIG